MYEGTVKDKMNEVLSGEVLKSALDFAAYLEANEMDVIGAEVSYKGKAVCYMYLGNGEIYPSPWTIWTEGDYSNESETIPMNEQMKEIAWANINRCDDCGAGCTPGKYKLIFGKEFDHMCNADMAFYMPVAETLECLKKLLEMRKHYIDTENEEET